MVRTLPDSINELVYRTMAEILGLRPGFCEGRGGSMHIADIPGGNLGATGVVGSGIPTAVGIALALQMRRSEQVLLCFFGDGAAAEGEFHETMNLAALWDLPVLFVCENNGYAMGTAIDRYDSDTDIHQKAAAYGIESRQVDGMDVVAVEAAARRLEELGVPILGTSVNSIDAAEDRRKFEDLTVRLEIATPEAGTATSLAEALQIAHGIGYPVLVRPSYVLGGRAMQIVYDEEMLREYFTRAVQASPEHPVLLDRFLEDAFEADVDAVCDGDRVLIGGVMQHIEEAGIHSGDSACSIPVYSLGLIHTSGYRPQRENASIGSQSMLAVGIA